MTKTNERLAWQQAIQGYSEQLVEAADQTLPESRVNSFRSTSQLKLLLSVAQETDSIAVITNWICYQMGRGKTRAVWKDTGLGKAVLAQIQEMKNWARIISQQVHQEEKPTEILRAQVTLVRLYAGYLRRCYVAKGGREE